MNTEKKIPILSSVYRNNIHEIRSLIKRSQGIVFLYLILFYFLKKVILFPLGGLIWSFTIAHSPARYITDGNIKMVFHAPWLILVGALLGLCFCLITIWEMSGIILCLEYFKQGKAPRLHLLFYISLKKVGHITRPNNWLFLVYIVIILPFTNVYNASGMLGKITLPEYISDFILLRWYLLIPLGILLLIFVVFALRWFYSIQSVVLKHNTFLEARKESVQISKGRMIRQTLDITIFSLVESIRICLLPGLFSLIAILTSLYLFKGYSSAKFCSAFIYQGFYLSIFKALQDIFLKISVSAYLVVTYTYLLRERGLDAEIDLPENVEKTKGIIFKMRHLKTFCFGSLTCIFVGFFSLLTIFYNAYPEYAKAWFDQKMILAHKGYSSIAPENTIDAFDAAYKDSHVSMIELDIRRTKDGIPVVIHNENVLEALGIKKSIYDMTYDEVRQYVASYKFPKSKFPNAYIPTLEEVLAKYGNKIPLLIEIKMSNRTPELPAQIVDLIHKYHAEDSCKIHSGSYRALELVKEADPDIPCGLIIAFGAGNYYSLPCADFFSVEHTFVNDNMLANVHMLNKDVYAWTVNEQESVESMEYLTVDGLITDRPTFVYNELHYTDDLLLDFLEHTADDITIHNTDDDEYSDGDY